MLEIIAFMFAVLFLVILIYFRLFGVVEKQGFSVRHDPLSEAEVFRAYGRSQQAIELLEQALRDGDQRPEVRERLAELKATLR